jgi:ABC-type polysaccharide/polyol phosphate transport system ATPase subunit
MPMGEPAQKQPDPERLRGAPVIRVDEVSKEYHLFKQKPFLVHKLAGMILGLSARAEICRALDHISFEVRSGESVAFIGRNGAGKSTLLSLIVGTILPTRGTIRVDGKIGALLELGVGFNPHLTGRENVYLNASLHGLSNREIDRRYRAIVEFSELGDFMDAPLVTYSSGMNLRLGFSVATQLDPDIIIVDEALAVGDQQFKQKCTTRVQEMITTGKTLLFVSHSANDVAKLCRRAVWLDHGRLVMDGPAQEVLAGYNEFSRSGILPPPA